MDNQNDKPIHRLGRRESEPHAQAISYLHDVLETNFPKDRVMWDLHHYFRVPTEYSKTETLDLQFDISFFKDFTIPEKLPSYTAADYNGRVSDLVINVLSKSTWRKDLLDYVAYCKSIKIPIYVVFFAYRVAPRTFPLPFMRVYIMQEDNTYKEMELHEIMYQGGKKLNEDAFISLAPTLPFGIALEKLDETYLGGNELFQAIIVDITQKKKLLTKFELEKEKAAKAEEKAAKAEEKAAKAEEKAAKAEEKAAKAEEKAKIEKKRADELEKELNQLRNKK